MKRSIFKIIFLMFITLGFYFYYLVYVISKEVNEITNNQKNNPVIDLLLSLLTFGLYTIYWYYKIGRQLEEYEDMLCMKKNSITILAVVIGLFLYQYGGTFISMAIVQNEINKILDEKTSF